jgi:hypothetical protein
MPRRCLTPRVGVGWIGQRAFDPRVTVFEELVLPHRCDLFHTLNRITARLERPGAMCRGDGNHHARLANGEPSDAMPQAQHRAGPVFLEFSLDLRERFRRHRLVDFVLEVRERPALCAANDAEKGHDGPHPSRIARARCSTSAASA